VIRVLDGVRGVISPQPLVFGRDDFGFDRAYE
jgi:hypothetical protein